MSARAKFKSWIQAGKDSSVAFVLEKLLQKRFERYGTMIEIKIESRQSTASVTLLLRGEREPVTINIERYELGENASGNYFTVRQATASREWLTLLLQDFLLNKEFPIPEKYAGYLRMIA